METTHTTTDARSAGGGTAHCTALRYPHILCCNTVTSWYVPTDTDIVTDVQTPPMMQQMGGDQPHPMSHVQHYQVGGASGRGYTPPYSRHPQYLTPPMQYPRHPGVMYPNQMMPGMGPSPSQSSANMGMMRPQSQLLNIPRPIPGAPTPSHPILSPYSYHQSIAPPSSLPAVPMTTATTSQVVSDWYQYGGDI